MILRDYQKECIDIVDNVGAGSYLISMATGLGKTCTFANFIQRGKTLVLAHREELINQPIKYYNCPVGVEMASQRSNGEDVVIASVQSLVRRLDRFNPNEFDRIITDECFPTGTLIGNTPIENIKVGDVVQSFNHNTFCVEDKRVLNLFKNPMPKRMVLINNEIICTTGHPIYELQKGEYINAIDIKRGDFILCYLQPTHELGRFKPSPKTPIQKSKKSLLLKGMLKRILQKNIIYDYVKDKSKICFCSIGTDEKEQSNVKTRNKRKSIKNTKEYGSQAKNKGWKWRINSPTNYFIKGIKWIKSSCGIFSSNEIKEREISRLLQNRYCFTRKENSNRSRRWFSLLLKNKRSGQKKNGAFRAVRVESVEILEQGCDERFAELCGDGYVYNIEVEDNNNYFANGYLVHNCHHSTSHTYRTIYNHFNFRQHIGVTATPNRHDKVGLENVFQKIIFERSLKWAIEQGFLCNIDCMRVDINYDLSEVATKLGDYAQNELAQAMDGTAEAIADVYHKKAKGQTLIFATSVKHAYDIASHIDGAVVVEAKTENRADIIRRFTEREIPCLVNCMIFTEGTDIPLIETIIVARPTQNVSLYTQMVGRGLRLYEGKEKLLLIDCVGVTRHNNLCTAPSLIGLSIRELQKKQQDEIEGDLFDLEELIIKKSDNIKNWTLNAKFVDIWAKEQEYNTHDMNLFKLPNGDLVCQLPDRVKYLIPAPNELGQTQIFGIPCTMQQALDNLYDLLRTDYTEQKYIWDKALAQKSWGKAPASEAQMRVINRKLKGEQIEPLTKFEASLILNRLYA